MTTEVILMGFASSAFSILTNIAINELFARRRTRRDALVLLKTDLILTTDLMQMWLDRPAGVHWNGTGPRIRPLSSLATLGTSMSHLPSHILLSAQRMELLLLEAQRLCGARQDAYSTLRLKGVERSHPKASSIEAEWDMRVVSCLELARDLQRETDAALASVGRTAFFAPM